MNLYEIQTNNVYLENTTNKYSNKSSKNKRFDYEIEDNLKSSKSEEEIKGNFLTYLEQNKSFDNIHSDDVEFFSSLINDDKLTTEELLSVPYDKLDSFYDFIGLSSVNNDISKIPILQQDNKSFYLSSAYHLSNDREFNNALFNTYKDLEWKDGLNDIMTLSMELNYNLEQVKDGLELDIYYMNNGKKQPSYEKTNINDSYNYNFDNILNTIINKANIYFEDPSINHEAKKQLLKTKGLYSRLLDNYNKVRIESKDI